MNKGFTFFEAILAIALMGAIGLFGYSYLNSSTLYDIQSKSSLQTHIALLQSMILECKTLSEKMPKQSDGTDTSATLISQTVCQTSPSYNLDGGRNTFVPKSPAGFDSYTATESGGAFYITLSAASNTRYAEMLTSLSKSYTATQATLHENGGKTFLDIYIQR